jgi:hypothetical protein
MNKYLTMQTEPKTTQANEATMTRPEHNQNSPKLLLAFMSLSLVLAVSGLTVWATAPKSRVTAVLITYKQSFIEAFEFGQDELYIELEYERDGQMAIHRTGVLPVTKLGNGVTWDVSESNINHDELRKIRVLEEDLLSDDIYDSIDVTLGKPLVGSLYHFHVIRTVPFRSVYVPLLYGSAVLLLISLIFALRRIAR